MQSCTRGFGAYNSNSLGVIVIKDVTVSKTKSKISLILISVSLLFSGFALAQEEPSECVETGALAYDNWTKVDSGGDGNLPGGVQSADYIRCKACHGWDRRGTDGGYVRRSRQESRPNAGAGDGDSTSREIVTGTVTAAQITHNGTGRSYAQGQGSWVPLDANRSASNTAEHAAGYTLGNQHPDFSSGGMTQEQMRRAMEPFGQVEAAYSRTAEGTGLGLPLTKALVELHDAEFKITSKPEVGTDVSVSFPIYDQELDA